jgi:hypothetical protein
MNNTGGPAFPLHPVCMKGQEGMTLRDYFAARAMEGDISRVGYYQCGQGVERAAANAYAMADAMLKAREE